jgi:erythromycin esterase-like protein
MGTYLRRHFGRQLLTIGNLIRQGEVKCGPFGQTLEQAPPDSLDGLAGEVGVPAFLLDLRAAPPAIGEWLDQEHALGQGEHILELPIRKAFDVLFYLDTVTPACIA